jgi:hypothetical protein
MSIKAAWFAYSGKLQVVSILSPVVSLPIASDFTHGSVS